VRDKRCSREGGGYKVLARREHFVVAAFAATKNSATSFPRAKRGAVLLRAPPRAVEHHRRCVASIRIAEHVQVGQ
jgi:hypothetical protein